jgi:hypothetical protein
MPIGNASLLIDLLNAASTHVADVASGAARQLDVGSVYEFQALTTDATVGFGATSAAAITDGDASHGVKLVADAPPRIFTVPSASVSFVGCAGGTLRIRRCAT